MGNGGYSFESRATRSLSQGFQTKSAEQIFTQRSVHETMDSRKIKVRECFDIGGKKKFPFILALDVTGSMGKIPHHFVKEGLPTMMSTLIESGTDDASLLFIAVGDHKCDQAPVQAGQFESSDEALDTWLTRTWIEGGGGGNGGESYPLVWEFAANRVSSHQWSNRHKKGVLFTIGDEPFHGDYSRHAFSEIYPLLPGESSQNAEQMLKAAQEKFHVFHINLREHRPADPRWKSLMGENLIECDDFRQIPKIIAGKILELRDTGTISVDGNTGKSALDKEETPVASKNDFEEDPLPTHQPQHPTSPPTSGRTEVEMM